MNHEEHIVPIVISNLKFSRVNSNLCDYSDANIHVKGTITVPNTAGTGANVNNTNERVIFKNCSPLANCISEINSTQKDDTKDVDLVMLMYNLIEYSDVYLKTSGDL